MPLFRWNDSFFDRHTLSKPLIERISMYSEGFRYLGQCKGFTINFIEAITSKIVLLLLACRPSAIAGFIVPVSINSVNCHSFRALAHIHEKILKRINPSIAYFYAPATVVTKKLTFWIMASLLHTAPRLIGGATRKPGFGIGLVKFISSRRRKLAMKASAGFAIAANKVIASDRFNYSAIALANPSRPNICKITSKDKKSGESFVSQVNKVRHKIISLCLTLYQNNAIKQGGY